MDVNFYVYCCAVRLEKENEYKKITEMNESIHLQMKVHPLP